MESQSKTQDLRALPPNVEELMMAEVTEVRAMQFKANCFYETQMEAALLNLSIDLKLAEMPDFKSVEEKALVELVWDQDFKVWELKKAIRSIIFAFMVQAQNKEDKIKIVLISIARLLETYKYLSTLVGIQLEDAADTIGKLI